MPTTDSAFVPKYGEGSFAQTYTSFSGVDIQAVFGDTKIGNLQGVSYSITRENSRPLSVMAECKPSSIQGNPNSTAEGNPVGKGRQSTRVSVGISPHRLHAGHAWSNLAAVMHDGIVSATRNSGFRGEGSHILHGWGTLPMENRVNCWDS